MNDVPGPGDADFLTPLAHIDKDALGADPSSPGSGA
jgi:hypothetical protein